MIGDIFFMELDKGRFDAKIYLVIADILTTVYILSGCFELYLLVLVYFDKTDSFYLIFPILLTVFCVYGSSYLLTFITGYKLESINWILKKQKFPDMTLPLLYKFLAQYWFAFHEELKGNRIYLKGTFNGEKVHGKNINVIFDKRIVADSGVSGTINNVVLKDKTFYVILERCEELC